MQKKLLAYCAGAFAAGAALSWAVTADIYELRARRQGQAMREVMKGQAKTIAELSERKQVIQLTQNIYSDRVLDPADIYIQTKDLMHKAEARLNDVPVVEPVADPELTQAVIESGEIDEQATAHFVESDVPEGETLEQTRERLHDTIAPYLAGVQDVEDFVEEHGKTFVYDATPPFVIKWDQMGWDADEENQHDSIHLTYYPKHRIVLDEDDELIPTDEVAMKIGWANLKQIGGPESDDANMVYIRNRKELTDYEVQQEQDGDPPIHISYGMPKDEFRNAVETGRITLPEDS